MKPPETVAAIENHHQAYHVWKERGVRELVLVHVDAHSDFGWIPEIDLDEIGNAQEPAGRLINPFLRPRQKMLDIGNYICPAMREGMVKKFYWVVPDASWESRRGRRHILRQLKHILSVRKHAGGRLQRQAGYIRCSVLGGEVTVCSLSSLPRIDEPALLDIDVDFMLTPHIWNDLDPRRFPWINADELVQRLKERVRDIDTLTVAYSVEGGFTPLRFKYFGDEIVSLFRGQQPPTMQLKKAAREHEQRGRLAEACAAYERALEIDGADASAWFNLFVLRPDGAYFDRALSADRSYSTRYNNYGILYLRHNELGRAEAEYTKLVRLRAADAAVFNGLGYIALARRRYCQALGYFQRCLAADAAFSEARLGRAIVAFRLGRLQEAEEFFQAFRRDYPDEQEPCWWLGRIAHKRNNAAAAIAHYKDAVVRGGEGPLVHLLLAMLYLKRMNLFRAFEEIKRIA